MTRKTESEINFNIINENFPIAGEDNDTQVFRDNFDSIKNNFRLAQEELTDLLDNTARKDEINNFANNTIESAVFLDTKYAKFDAGNIASATSAFSIDYQNGSYQIIRVDSRGTPLNITFDNFPRNNDRLLAPFGVGKVTLEIWSDLTDPPAPQPPATITINFSTGGNGTKFRIKGFPDGPRLINGDPAPDQEPVSITLRSSNKWPSGGPIFIEVWRHRTDFIFMHYLGTFNE
jgi:hypothetical protein